VKKHGSEREDGDTDIEVVWLKCGKKSEAMRHSIKYIFSFSPVVNVWVNFE
jgi:hypothetical protein